MFKVYLSLILFAGIIVSFAETPLRFSKERLTGRPGLQQKITRPVIEKTRALIPNNVFSRALAKGTRWGAIGAVAGAGLGLLAKDDMGLVPVFFSILGGSAGFATGFSWGVFNKKTRKALRRHLPKNYRIGFNMEINGALVDGQQINEPSFGLILRWPGERSWISKPNYLRVYYGVLGADNGTRTKPQSASISDQRFGIEVLKIRRDHIIHFFYGLGTGYSSGTYLQKKEGAGFSNARSETSAFIDLILGVNLNFTDFSQAQLVYKWEPLGIRNRVSAADNFSPGINHLIGFSFIVFLF